MNQMIGMSYFWWRADFLKLIGIYSEIIYDQSSGGRLALIGENIVASNKLLGSLV